MLRNTTTDPYLSIIIPVYSEENTINATLNHVRSMACGESVEIIVADGGPGHATLKAIRDEDVVKVECPPGRGGQMNAGAALAGGEALLFLHADTRLPADAVRIVRETLDRTVAGAFTLGIDSSRISLKLVACFANWRTRLERVPYGDQAQFIRADLFRSMGGFADIPIMEDVELFRRIRMDGLSITIVKDRVRTSPRRWETEGIWQRTLKNWWLRIRYRFGVSPFKLAGHYRPHDDKTDKS